MSFSLFKKLVEEVDSYPCCHLHLCGLGEPAMHPEIGRFLDHLHPKRMKVSLATNGLLFDKFEAKRVLSWDTDLLTISVDGHDAESYHKHRVGGDYQRLVSNVKELYQARTRQKKRYPIIRIASVLLPGSMAPEQIAQFRQQWMQHADMVEFTIVIPLEPKKYAAFSQCSDTFFGICVRWDGRVPICDYYSTKWIGDVTYSSMREVFTSPSLRELQACHFRKNYTKIEFCSTCFYAQDKVRIADSNKHNIHKNKLLTGANYFYRKFRIGRR